MGEFNAIMSFLIKFCKSNDGLLYSIAPDAENEIETNSPNSGNN